MKLQPILNQAPCNVLPRSGAVIPTQAARQGTMPMYRECWWYLEQLLSSKAARVTPSRREMEIRANVLSWQG